MSRLALFLLIASAATPASATECQTWVSPAKITVSQVSPHAPVSITVMGNYAGHVEGPVIQGYDITYTFIRDPCPNGCSPAPPGPPLTTVLGNLVAGTYTVHVRWPCCIACETTQQFSLAETLSVPALSSVLAACLGVALAAVAAARLR